MLLCSPLSDDRALNVEKRDGSDGRMDVAFLGPTVWWA